MSFLAMLALGLGLSLAAIVVVVASVVLVALFGPLIFDLFRGGDRAR